MPNETDYTISPEDLLDINVMDVQQVSRTYRVSSNGFLTLPLLSQPLAAAGLTMEQLASLIANKYREAGMLNDAQVTVTLKETRRHTVFVSGAVKHPQGYTIYGPTRLFDLLILAGGPTEDAGDDAVITRGEEGLRADSKEGNQEVKPGSPPKEASFRVEIRQLLQTGEGKSNILLYPGDRVIVSRASLIYVLGAVARPGGYVLSTDRENYTVLKALALAGGLSSVAKEKKITVLRKDPSAPEGKREEISVNFKSIVSGNRNDMKLIPDDILYVPESGLKKGTRTALATALSAGTTIGTGMAIYRP
jgi:polysaccharide export outer membrane protein